MMKYNGISVVLASEVLHEKKTYSTTTFVHTTMCWIYTTATHQV
jgi:hypothetical protein